MNIPKFSKAARYMKDKNETMGKIYKILEMKAQIKIEIEGRIGKASRHRTHRCWLWGEWLVSLTDAE